MHSYPEISLSGFHAPSSLRGQYGLTLYFVLATIVILSILLSILFQGILSDNRISSRYSHYSQAELLAHSGVSYALSHINSNHSNA
jgi:Tfp pilus assembly protein PilX